MKWSTTKARTCPASGNLSVTKKVYIDVMVLGGVKFYCTLPFRYNPTIPIDEEEVKKYVISKCPTLKYQPFTVAFNL